MVEVLPVETPTLGDRSPLVTSGSRMMLAEFGYDLKRTPTFPFIDTLMPRYDMWLLERYGLPSLYWNLMLKGLA